MDKYVRNTYNNYDDEDDHQQNNNTHLDLEDEDHYIIESVYNDLNTQELETNSQGTKQKYAKLVVDDSMSQQRVSSRIISSKKIREI
ncbi:unnamed protein product [Rotaria sordida]|uniref:Uncharacterized protein n=1 Tax=Rotaria sordida TaxID=392033 RepID=A0A814C511_9BILA|nr:unnamed protein product [Rotaria sordida]